MDIYDFAERDDQTHNKQSKHLKAKKRKITTEDCNQKTEIKRKRGRKSKVVNNDEIVNSNSSNPPIRIKLIRDTADPNAFKSIPLFNQILDYESVEKNCRPVFNYKVLDGREFSINDVVWAKLDGFPLWPSKVINIFVPIDLPESALSAEEVVATVEWLTYDRISYIKCANLFNFSQEFEKRHNLDIRDTRYHEAVNEARQLAAEVSEAARLGSSNSVHSCETFEADTSSGTLPSHNFTSPESNQSLQSGYHQPAFSSHSSSSVGGPLHPGSGNSVPAVGPSSCLCGDVEESVTTHPDSRLPNTTTNTGMVTANIPWELPDLGSNLFLEDTDHIPEFSDSDDEPHSIIDINKITSLINVSHQL